MSACNSRDVRRESNTGRLVLPQPNGVARCKGRDARGRFLPGKPVARNPGIPNGQRVARFRRILLREIDQDDVLAILRKLVAQAKEGNVAAAKVLLEYSRGAR